MRSNISGKSGNRFYDSGRFRGDVLQIYAVKAEVAHTQADLLLRMAYSKP